MARRTILRLFALAAMLLLPLGWAGAPATARAQDGHPPAADTGHDDHPDTAHGAAAHEKGEVIPPVRQGLPVMIAAFVVFGIVVLVLSSKVWPTILKGLDDRSAKIKSEIEAAEAARRQAKDALEQYQKSLAEARAEAQKMLEKTKSQQQALADELRAKSEVELTAMKDRARRDIEAAKRAALAEISAQMASLSTSIAAKILRREIRPADQQRLVDESLGELEALKS